MNWGDDNLDGRPNYTFYKGMVAGILLTAALIVLGDLAAKRAAPTERPVCTRYEHTIIAKYGPSGALIDEIPAVVCLEYAE